LLGRQNISEQGIPSDITEGVLNRLDYVYKVKPQVCLIMIGVNDVFSWIPNDIIMGNYIQIIENLKKKNIIPIIQSVLYAAEIQPSAQNRNAEITKLNKLLANYAQKNGYEFVDLNRRMSRNGFLKSNLTYDGLHLNGDGFKYWGREVDKILRKFSL
jgi:lysophospholipase L1-like esterase